MAFVYLHVVWFGAWIGFGVEKYPFGLLTMIVSLEAIFLSTFVMISQNRADAKRQVLADEQWKTVQEEDQQNQQLLDLSKQILDLTKEVHAHYRSIPNSGQGSSDRGLAGAALATGHGNDHLPARLAAAAISTWSLLNRSTASRTVSPSRVCPTLMPAAERA